MPKTRHARRFRNAGFAPAMVIGAVLLTACSGGARPTIESDPAGAATPPPVSAAEADATAAARPTTTSTATSTSTSTSTTVPLPPIVLHGTGDVNLDTGTIPNLSANGFGWALSGLEGQFLDDDLTLINLECTPSDQGTRQDRPFNFRCSPDGLPEMKAEGVDLVNLGNNHAMDYGAEGLVDGLARVRAAELAVVGAGADRAEAFAPAVLDAAGADIVLGHHQHRLQPMEQIGDAVVFWGLGNFVWPRNSAASADTAVARVEVASDGRLTGCLLDATIRSAGHPTLDNPEQTTCEPDPG